MTENELNIKFAYLADAHAKTEEEMRLYFEESRAANAELKLMIRETSADIREASAIVKETSAQMKKTDEQMRKTDEQMKKTDEQMKKTDEKLKSLGIHIGGMANSHGLSTEEYFFNSLEDDKRLGNLNFDEISKNLHNKIPNLEDEFDITMFNGKNVALIECKYNAKEEDVVKLIEKKVSNFRILFPTYANRIFYLGIASFSFDKRVEKFAKENGVAILRQRGEVVEIIAENLKAY